MKTAIVTGGTKGLGRAISLEMGRAGYHIISLYGADQGAAENLRGELARARITGDVANFIVGKHSPADLVKAFPSLATAENEILLINNAGPKFVPKHFHLIAAEEFDEMYRVFFLGAAQLSAAFLPQMARGRKGGIVNILTALLTHHPEDLPPRGFSAYLAMKAAVATLTKSLGAEYSSRGVKIISVSPGFMRTELTTQNGLSGLPPQDANFKASPISPEEVAAEIRRLYLDPKTPGRGENYFVP